MKWKEIAMRIISGKLKGRRLASPADRRIRPTTDKVKEAIFSMIAGWIGEESVCVDLFCGTGNLGLEAISRGAKTVYFCDNHRESLNLTKSNVRLCQAENQAVLMLGDYAANLKRISQKADVIFLDPPYSERLVPKCLEAVVQNSVLAPDGIVVAEHLTDDLLPREVCGLEVIKERRYGTILVTIYGYPQEEED